MKKRDMADLIARIDRGDTDDLVKNSKPVKVTVSRKLKTVIVEDDDLDVVTMTIPKRLVKLVRDIIAATQPAKAKRARAA